MAPTRPLKRQKTNPTPQPQPQSQPESLNQPPPSQIPLPPESTPPTPNGSQSNNSNAGRNEARSVRTSQPQLSQNSPPIQSFFSRTWPRKAPPLTAFTRESVSSATSAAQEAVTVVKDKVKTQRSPSLAMTLGKSPPNTSNRSLPVDATTTIVNAVPASPKPRERSKSQADLAPVAKEDSIKDKQANGKDETNRGIESQPSDTAKVAATTETSSALTSAQRAPDGQTGWLSWLSRREDPKAMPAAEILTKQSSEEQSTLAESANATAQPPAPVNSTSASAETSQAQGATNKRNWYQMWSSEPTSEPVKEPPSIDHNPATNEQAAGQTDKLKNIPQSLKIPDTQTPKTASQASSLETSPPPPLPGDASKSSGWVFWSRDRNPASTSKSDNPPHIGELAISDTPSQQRPKRASISLPDDQKPVLKSPPTDEVPKKGKDQKLADDKGVITKNVIDPAKSKEPKTPQTVKTSSTKQNGSTTKAESSNATAKARGPVEVETPRTGSPAPSKKETPNLLLPQFKDTLSLRESPSILQQLARLLYYTKEPEFKHLHLVKDPPRISNALAIGVHGYFPAPLIRSVLGQPTGTSIKFADMAASAIKRWTHSRGYSCEVKSAALEGEGRISERVELLWKLLLNWIDEIRKSDFVMIACHSQGVPVAIMLVAKLIAFGCISGARVGICAMAGVNMGPFAEYKSRWISGSAGELFEFSDPNSKVSTDYLAAIEEVLKHGVRLTLVGSIDDQLVSMESSIFAPITHPHIYRAVFVDGRIHAPNFLSHLVGFAMKLRNVGVPDHGLIKELSPPLAGSLYTGEGHSRIYEDDTVYDLAIQFALETTTLKDVPITKRPITSAGGNPYILPFAMRGILEEDYVKTELQHEAQELLAQFDDWKPTTKALKDVKFRLEGIRSKL